MIPVALLMPTKTSSRTSIAKLFATPLRSRGLSDCPTRLPCGCAPDNAGSRAAASTVEIGTYALPVIDRQRHIFPGLILTPMGKNVGQSNGRFARQDWVHILRHLGPHAPCGTTADGARIRFTTGSSGRYLFFVGSHTYACDSEHAYRCQAGDGDSRVDVFYKGVHIKTLPGPLS